MARKYPELQYIANNEPITSKNHREFLYLLQRAILLALREQGSLTAAQHRRAEEMLKHQYWEPGETFPERGTSK